MGLCLTVRDGSAIRIGSARVTVEARGRRVRVRIEAPPEVTVTREGTPKPRGMMTARQNGSRQRLAG